MTVSDLSALDDLRLIRNDLGAHAGFTLSSVVRNEMYFLPAFLAHYRDLGVERFIFLDDRSDDGTREYLCEQPDCMVLGSSRRFGEIVAKEPQIAPERQRNVGHLVWRNLLLRKYSLGQWALHVDADEFLRIPDGMKIRDLLPVVEASGANAVWSVMLDMYPAEISRLRAMRGEAVLDRDADWYYDARPHLVADRPRAPRIRYAGSRARLMQLHGIARPRYGLREWLTLRPVRRRIRGHALGYNCIFKPSLLKMPPDGLLRNPHFVDFPAAPGIVLPLEHYKFVPEVYDRVADAVKSRQYFRGSAEYAELDRLLMRMAQVDGSFLCECSSNARSFEDYLRAGVASGVSG